MNTLSKCQVKPQLPRVPLEIKDTSYIYQSLWLFQILTHPHPWPKTTQKFWSTFEISYPEPHGLFHKVWPQPLSPDNMRTAVLIIDHQRWASQMVIQPMLAAGFKLLCSVNWSTAICFWNEISTYIRPGAKCPSHSNFSSFFVSTDLWSQRSN